MHTNISMTKLQSYRTQPCRRHIDFATLNCYGNIFTVEVLMWPVTAVKLYSLEKNNTSMNTGLDVQMRRYAFIA